MRRLIAAAVLVGSACAGRAQRETFEVASIKRNNSGSDRAGVRGNAGRVTITNNPLRNIIRNAWGPPPSATSLFA